LPTCNGKKNFHTHIQQCTKTEKITKNALNPNHLNQKKAIKERKIEGPNQVALTMDTQLQKQIDSIFTSQGKEIN